MFCNRLTGNRWLQGVLTIRDTTDALFDPQFLIRTDSSGNLIGRFVGANENDFPVTCLDIAGGKSEISFTRVVRGGPTTHYQGTVIEFGNATVGNRAVVGIVRGTFTRTMTGSPTIVGDWETEKPT